MRVFKKGWSLKASERYFYVSSDSKPAQDMSVVNKRESFKVKVSQRESLKISS